MHGISASAHLDIGQTLGNSGRQVTGGPSTSLPVLIPHFLPSLRVLRSAISDGDRICTHGRDKLVTTSSRTCRIYRPYRLCLRQTDVCPPSACMQKPSLPSSPPRRRRPQRWPRSAQNGHPATTPGPGAPKQAPRGGCAGARPTCPRDPGRPRPRPGPRSTPPRTLPSPPSSKQDPPRALRARFLGPAPTLPTNGGPAPKPRGAGPAPAPPLPKRC